MKPFTAFAIVGIASVFAGCAPTAEGPQKSSMSGEAGSEATASEVPATEASAEMPAEAPAGAGFNVSPLAAYENLSRRLNAVLSSVKDGPSAKAAADALPPLTEDVRASLRPYLAALAVMPDAAREAYLQKMEDQALQEKSSQTEVDHDQLIEIARQPGNESLKAALESLFQAMMDEGSSGIRRSVGRWMEKLNKS